MRNAIAYLAIMAALLTGCTSLQSTAGKTLASTALTVDAAMQGWAAWVDKGQAAPDQQQNVRDVYAKYQASMDIAKTAYQTAVATGDQSGWLQAQRILQMNQAALLNLIQTFQTSQVLQLPK